MELTGRETGPPDAGAGEPDSAGDAPVVSLAIAERRIVIADPELQRRYRLLERLARSELPILVRGEPGTGKATAARAVHAWSPRAAAPLLFLDCAAQPEAQIERALFGCERGALGSASSRRPGLLERARGGTLVLEHVHQLAPAMQTRLAHALEHRRVLRLGGKHERPIDVRIVATTTDDLAGVVAAGGFRHDLHDRLSAATVTLPPLRTRARDAAALAQHFLAQDRAADGGQVAISPAALALLAAHRWPGNVRELEHAMAYAAALIEGDRLEPWHLPETVVDAPAPAEPASPDAPAAPVARVGSEAAPEPGTDPAARPAASFRPIAEELQALERRRMTEALRATGGVQRRAAELIGMPVRTFTFKLTQYGLRAGAPAPAASGPSSRIARRRSRDAGPTARSA